MRHDRGTQHARRKKHGIGALKTRQQPGNNTPGVRRVHEQAGNEADGDHGKQHHDRVFERPLSTGGLERKQEHGRDADDDATGQKGQPEEKIQGHGAADDLRHVRCPGNKFCLESVQPAAAGAQAPAEDFRQTQTGRQTKLG